MRFVPTPTAWPQWRRGGFLVTAVARYNAAVPRSPLMRPYVPPTSAWLASEQTRLLGFRSIWINNKIV